VLRARGHAGVVLGMFLVLTGCIAPSDPAGVPVGLRVDGGVISMYAPLCPGETVTSANIDLPQGNGKQVWTGEGPLRPDSKVVRFDQSGWKKTTGSFRYTGQDFSINVSGTVQSYGAATGTRKLPSDLPPGVYDSDGQQVTAADLDSQRKCEKSG